MVLVDLMLVLYTVAFRLIPVLFAETVVFPNPPFFLLKFIYLSFVVLHKGHIFPFRRKQGRNSITLYYYYTTHEKRVKFSRFLCSICSLFLSLSLAGSVCPAHSGQPLSSRR